MSDPELHRLTEAVDAARGGYQDALMRLVEYGTKLHGGVVREAKADPVTAERVRDAIGKIFARPGRSPTELTSEQLASWLSHSVNELPEPKTLMNVYLPAIRDTCPHAVQSGRTWLWYRDAKLGSRDAVPSNTLHAVKCECGASVWVRPGRHAVCRRCRGDGTVGLRGSA